MEESKNTTLAVNSQLHVMYGKHCKKDSGIVSRSFEKLTEEEKRIIEGSLR